MLFKWTLCLNFSSWTWVLLEQSNIRIVASHRRIKQLQVYNYTQLQEKENAVEVLCLFSFPLLSSCARIFMSHMYVSSSRKCYVCHHCRSAIYVYVSPFAASLADPDQSHFPSMSWPRKSPSPPILRMETLECPMWLCKFVLSPPFRLGPRPFLRQQTQGMTSGQLQFRISYTEQSHTVN